MEKRFESWFQGQQIDPNLSSAPGFRHRHRLNIPSLGNALSPYGNPLEFAFPASKPDFLTPVVNSIPKGKLPEPVQKKFLVFDQSNDRTTLIYSSIPIPYHLPEPQFTFDLKKEDLVIGKHEDTHSSNSFHEDTEEIRALLYSDDDGIDDSEDEEEQSTGHSPVMGFDSHEWAEEVASSVGCRKRRKPDSGEYDMVSLEDTASSGKSGVNCSGEGELSSCGNHDGTGNSLPDVESETFPAGKRSRTEKVRETISELQNLIPGGKNGKDAMAILDEAINYLRIMKVKAKALGLDSL